MRFSKVIRRGSHQQNLSTFLVERKTHGDAGFLKHLLLKVLERRFERLFRKSEVVADAVNLADDLVAIFLALADRIHDFAPGHGDFGGVDAVGAVDRAAPALRALVEVAVPVVEHLLGEIPRADQPRQILAGQGEVTPVDLAQQILAGDRHVFRIAGAEEVVALVGAGAAFDAGVKEDAERSILAAQLGHLRNGFILPVLHQLPGKTERLLKLRSGDVRFAGSHAAWDEIGNLKRIRELAVAVQCFQLLHGVSPRVRPSMIGWPPVRAPNLPSDAARADCRSGYAWD